MRNFLEEMTGLNVDCLYKYMKSAGGREARLLADLCVMCCVENGEKHTVAKPYPCEIANLPQWT
jgi:hypothetical protein